MAGQRDFKVIVGLGYTGLSCARFLGRQGIDFAVTDNREQPPQKDVFLREFPHIPLVTGQFCGTLLESATEIILSPGVSLQEPAIARQVAQHKSVVGDIELLARMIKKPLLGITGSNGKTTVTTLLGLMLQEAGLSGCVCGNIGKPVLDCVESSGIDYYVVELSSFQLETTTSLAPAVATVLNVTPDHMDRYSTYADYLRAKQRIYAHCQHPVINADEPAIWRDLTWSQPPITFGLNEKNTADFSVQKRRNRTYLTYQHEPLMATDELTLNASHHWKNALAALAMGQAIALPMEKMLNVLRHFQGLPHRCQWVRRYREVDWYNDSKGTNIGATQEALISLGRASRGKIVLIAGGLSKGADFSDLKQPVAAYVRHIILIGRDAPILEATFKGITAMTHVSSLEKAVDLAAQLAEFNDTVLFSPACASFDMFNNFEHRGEVFMKAVKAL